MNNLDQLLEQKNKILNRLAESIRSSDDEGMRRAMSEFGEFTRQQVLAEAQGVLSSVDSAVLAGRGVRQLTSAETNYYKQFISAARSLDPRQEIANISVAFPETVIDSVLEDIQEEHPLLEAVDFVNTALVTKWFYNKEEAQLAKWGKITDKIQTELSGSIGEIDLTACKLSAFMCVSNDLLDAGPAWVDRYVRAILVDALAAAMETAIITGTGNGEPIGMDRSVAEDVTVTGGVYPQKEAVVLEEINPATYGALVAKLAKTATGRSRAVTGLILVVNPVDYFSKVMPATTVMAPDGTYRNDVLPYPTQVIQSVGAAENSAVFGMGKKYFMGLGTGKDGKLEYDDSVKFLDDQRAYKIKLIGNGRAKDDNAFLRLDITDLKPLYWAVQQVAAAQAAASGTDGTEAS